MTGFKKATKSQARLRLALVGISGAGKTYTALRIAVGLGERIAVIDTERGSASKYAGDVCDFDVLELETFAPRQYVQAIRAADAAGYDVLIIDSLSHAWMGKGGALEMADEATKRSKSGNSFNSWREVTPEHQALLDAILSSRCHVIATMRVKTEYDYDTDARGKKVPRKIGTKPVQREGTEFEFDVVADMTQDHEMVISKTRCAALDRAVIPEPGADVAEILKAWLTDGAPIPVKRGVRELLADLGTVREGKALEGLRGEAKAMRAGLSREDQLALSKAIEDARTRIEADAREAAEAEKHLGEGVMS